MTPSFILHPSSFILPHSSFILHPSSFILPHRRRGAFTLMELLIVMMIMTLLAGLALSVMAGATEAAREQRTRAIIAKIDQLIMDRYEGYRTRAVPVRIPAGTPPRVAAEMRLNALRDLMRMEMPERTTDVEDPPCDCDPRTGNNPMTNQPYVLQMASPSLRNSYTRQAIRNCGANWKTNWTIGVQGSECLYLILSSIQDGDKNALDYFDASEIGDTDGDGMKEILDAWGQAILFLRWPAGYTVEQPGGDAKWGNAGNDDDGLNGADDVGEWLVAGSDDHRLTTAMQSANPITSPDPFDPARVGGGFALHPLIMSAGRDRQMDMGTDTPGLLHYSPPSTSGNNAPNPYVYVQLGIKGQLTVVRVGTPADVDDSGEDNYADNITNHFMQTP